MNKTFEQLWNEAYVAYLKLRSQCGIPLTSDQKQLVEKSVLSDEQKAWIKRYGGDNGSRK